MAETAWSVFGGKNTYLVGGRTEETGHEVDP